MVWSAWGFYSIVPNFVYILSRTAGLSPAEVAQIQAVGGVAVLFGRICFGYLLDRIHAPYVGVMAVTTSACCALIYATVGDRTVLFLAAIMSGFAIGGGTRSAALSGEPLFRRRRSVSRIFGWFLFAFSSAPASGRPPSRRSRPHMAASSPAVHAGGAAVIPGLLFLSLGRYPASPEPAQRDGALANAA